MPFQVLYNFKRDFGWNWLGNLVGLGGLAFTPATPEVLRFAQHMSRTHAFFDDVFIGVYDNPVRCTAEGLGGPQLHHGRPELWALVTPLSA